MAKKSECLLALLTPHLPEPRRTLLHRWRTSFNLPDIDCLHVLYAPPESTLPGQERADRFREIAMRGQTVGLGTVADRLVTPPNRSSKLRS